MRNELFVFESERPQYNQIFGCVPYFSLRANQYLHNIYFQINGLAPRYI